jgi:exodeoxyribonuclease-1
MTFQFQDPRLEEMLFRYRSRNFPDTLDEVESQHWQAWCAEQLTANPNGVGLTAQAFFRRLAELAQSHPQQADLLAALRRYGEQVCERAGVTP